MPHIQPKTTPKASPLDVDHPLDLIAGAGISILGVTGGQVEFEGALGIMVRDEDIQRIRDLLPEEHTEYLDESDGLHLDYVEHESGRLLEALRRGRRHHVGGVVDDICVGVETMTFSIHTADDPNLGVRAGDVVRDGDGHPIEDPNQGQVTAFPVQIHFIVPVPRDEDGIAIP